MPKQSEPAHWDTLSTETAAPPASTDDRSRNCPQGLPGGADEPPAGSFPPSRVDNFRIIRSLGQGGMGHVYLAQDTSIDRLVAIKFIREPGKRQRASFRIEAQAAGKLDHPNIVKIWHYDEIDGQPYIVVEYVDGKTLSAYPRPMPWQEALALALGMTSGLADAHRRGVLHRDIKPSNVIITPSGEPKLLDFGLAKLQGAADAHASAQPQEGTPGTSAGAPRRPHATEAGAILGTPYYMAPEAWRGESSYAADVYSLGVVLYELCTGLVPFHDLPRDELRRAVQERDAPLLSAVAPQVPPDFARVVEVCLARDPDLRFANGERLLAALLTVAPASRTSGQLPVHARDPEHERPYPGLRPFDTEEGRYFFGRDGDTGSVIARLRNGGMVLVAGSSGVGKSSLVRAGVLPYLAARGLDETGNAQRGWELRAWVPGMHPLQAMSAALRADLDLDEDRLSELLAHDPAEVGRRLQRRVHTGVVLFVDQLEELVTVADAGEAALTSRALATLAARFPRLRVLATVRGDKLIEVGALPGIDALIERALYILQPLGERQVRDAVVRPAERCGVGFASEAMVGTLVRDSISQAGGLPLLQSALALLWERRDRSGAMIPDTALSDIGGVAGALSQQADRVLDALLPETRAAARTILLRLVTLHGARVRHGKDDLVAGGAPHEAALAALVSGRLLVAREIDGAPVYELAHEALVHAWPALRAWLSEEDRLLQIRQQLARAAEDWERQGRPRELLWQGRRLRELEDVDANALVAREQAFVRESRRMARRAQHRRLLALAVVLGLVAGLYGWSRYARMREIQSYLDQAGVILDAAAALGRAYDRERDQAIAIFARFDATRPDVVEADLERGEALWQRAVHAAPEVDRKLLEATRPLELALLLDPGHAEVRRLLGHALHARALLAEDQGHTGELAVLRERLAVYDPGLAARWQRPGRVVVETWPAGLAAELHEYQPDAEGGLTLAPRGPLPAAPATAHLRPGSYLVVVPAQGQHPEVRHPFWLAPGRNLDPDPVVLRIAVPAAREVPADMVYVSEGWYWSGFGGDEIREPIRAWQLSTPPHQRRTGGFFIARHETTYAQWIEFVRALPPGERAARMPLAELDGTQVALLDSGGELVFRYRVESSQEPYTARVGERVRYRQRGHRVQQDWLRFPVTGVSGDDIDAYARWLSDRGVVPGARMCREDEWERAARGADLRVFPHGDRLDPDDANIDLTYGRKSGAYGLDEVGSHPRSQSPFGLDDMMGNAREMTRSILEVNKLAQRSGSFFHARPTNLIVNREVQLATQRNPFVGFRICAEPPPHLRGLR